MSNSLGEENIEQVLKEYYTERFQGISPDDFEFLIKLLLGRKYESAQVTQATGDFGADVIAKDQHGRKIICQVKRYMEGNNIGNKYINDCIAAIEYYDGDFGLFVTTSDFTSNAIEIANKANVELWNWNRLTSEISKHFFDGKDYNEYYSNTSEIDGDKQGSEKIKVSLDRISQTNLVKGDKPVNCFYITLKNESNVIVKVNLSEIAVIAQDNSQYHIDTWHEGYFRGGKIYPNAKVELSFFIRKQKAGILSKGTKVYLTARIDDKETLFQLEYGQNKDSEPNKSKFLRRKGIGNNIVLLKSPTSGKLKNKDIFLTNNFLKSEEVLCEVGGVSLKAGINGKVVEVCYDNGDKVSENDILFKLKSGKNNGKENRKNISQKYEHSNGIKLIKESNEGIIVLKSPIEGYFRQFIPNINKQEINPSFVIGKIDGTNIFAGVSGYLQKVIAKDGKKIEKGDVILRISKNNSPNYQNGQDVRKSNAKDTSNKKGSNFLVVLSLILVLILILLAYLNLKEFAF